MLSTGTDSHAVQTLLIKSVTLDLIFIDKSSVIVIYKLILSSIVRTKRIVFNRDSFIYISFVVMGMITNLIIDE